MSLGSDNFPPPTPGFEPGVPEGTGSLDDFPILRNFLQAFGLYQAMRRWHERNERQGRAQKALLFERATLANTLWVHAFLIKALCLRKLAAQSIVVSARKKKLV